ncbi:DNA binding protein VP4 [Gokushovirinae Fen7875_21]|uniref:DNA binding protein VP4 n=1 Tax=Gokushovirinae Fen7875_21 TaxID=1655659 RepID=UPI00063D564B|nr:DNA binding protein VP4 [Gokushovirinae Fen7875_21]AKI26941.1 DNA binding protein VP4 [Gokushovirinae Fen7875_21]ALS03711.1 VP5 [Gokushovirus WZ-2015a]
MKFEIVAIRDQAAAVYSRPFFVPTLGMAMRSFYDEAQRDAPDNELFRHPEDFTLWHLGTFDDNTGRFSNLEVPEQIATGKQMRG